MKASSVLQPGDRGTSGLPTTVQQVKSLPGTAIGSSAGLGLGNSSPSLSSMPPLPPIFSQAAPPPTTPIGVVYSLTHSPAASSPPKLVQTLPGSFPDIYDGDMKKWERHFHSIQRAYKEFGKEDDFAIRVLTEDFTLPFPFAWPSESEASRQPAYDPADCSGFDFFLHPGQPVPKILQPLHATTQAFFKKRRLEQLALSYASKTSLAGTMPGLPHPQESSPTLRPDFMVITSMPCMAAATASSESPFHVQEGKAHRNIQPAGPNSAVLQPNNLQFMNPTPHGPF